MHASVAVFPDPTTTNRLGASVSRARPLTGSTRASRPTSNGGGLSAGMLGARWWALTIRHDSGTTKRSPEMRETTVRSPS